MSREKRASVLRTSTQRSSHGRGEVAAFVAQGQASRSPSAPSGIPSLGVDFYLAMTLRRHRPTRARPEDDSTA